MFFKLKHSHRKDAKSAMEEKEDKESGLEFCFFAVFAVKIFGFVFLANLTTPFPSE